MILWATTALASDWRCQLLGPVPGTLGTRMTAEARESAGAIYGAVEVLNREVLPRMPEEGGVAYVGDTTIANVARLPVLLREDCPRDGDVGLYQYDVNAVNYAFAYRTGPITWMYSTSALMSYAPAGNFWRGTMPVINAFGGTYWAFAAPFVGADDDLYATNTYVVEYGLNYDFVLGATADLVFAEVGGGYVGSQGFYVTGLQPKIRLFGRAVTSDRAQRVPQAAAGVDRLPAKGMLSSLYARRVESGPLEQEGVPLLQRASRGTVHAAQEAIGGIVDVGVAALVSPRPGLHELRARIHPRTDADALAEDGLTPDQLPSVEIGTIQAPPVPEFGIEGRIRPHVALRYTGLIEKTLVTAELTLNSDEVLAAFPYAHDSVYLRIQVAPVVAPP